MLQLLLTTGLALALSALNVHLRDVEQILTNGLTLLFFLTPILYPVSTVPTTLHLGESLVVPLRPLYFLNPIAGLVQSYQNIFFFGREPHWIHLGTVTDLRGGRAGRGLVGVRPPPRQPGRGDLTR